MAERNARRRGFWLTNHVINPLLRRRLRGAHSHRMGRRLAVLGYRGRHTGQVHEVVVQFARDGARVWVMVGRPERKRWWRNLLEPALVDLRFAGRRASGVAQVISERGQPDEFGRGLATYLEKFPGALKETDRSGTPAVMVRIDLTHKVVEDDIGVSSDPGHETEAST